VNASSQINRMGWSVVIVQTLGLFILGFCGAVTVGLGCGENVDAGTSRGDVCAVIGEPPDARWWLFASAPALLFSAVALLVGRRWPLAGYLWGAACALCVAIDAVLVAIVTDNL
jgi:hypothetical protein